jgi:hypothetical protein
MRRTRRENWKSTRRKFQFELLEDRRLLASGWQNPLMAIDVDASGDTSPLDVLFVINRINSGLPNDFRQPVGGNPYYDVDGSGDLSPLDVLVAIHYLNAAVPTRNANLVIVSADRKSILTPSKIQGVPDLVVEILSSTDIKHDTMANRQLYERSGIPEYWIVDLEDHTALQLGNFRTHPFSTGR